MNNKLTAEEFYRRRDDRTNRLTESRDYHNLHIRLIADDVIVHSFLGQVQLVSVANMLARWCRWIEFGFSDAPLADILKVNKHSTLHERIYDEVSQADPFGRFTFSRERSPEVHYTLGVGKTNVHESASFTIGASGWMVYAGTHIEPPNLDSTDRNPIGASFAACIGVADAFKVAIGLAETSRVSQLSLSVFDFSNHLPPELFFPASVILGNVQLIGVGSVGSAVAYLLRMIPVVAKFKLIDHDLVEIENLNRSPLFGIKDDGLPKSEVAAQYLNDHIQAEPIVCQYDEFVKSHGRRPGDVDLIIPVANEYNVRRDIEHNYPPIQIYGTTTASWGVNYHRHIPLLNDDCSNCRFPTPNIQPIFPCSKTQVATQDEKPVDAALPFLSFSAAVLIVSDLIKLQMPGYPFIPNFAFIDFFDKMESTTTYQRRAKSGCICADRSRLIMNDYIGSTRYFELNEDK